MMNIQYWKEFVIKRSELLTKRRYDAQDEKCFVTRHIIYNQAYNISGGHGCGSNRTKRFNIVISEKWKMENP